MEIWRKLKKSSILLLIRKILNQMKSLLILSLRDVAKIKIWSMPWIISKK